MGYLTIAILVFLVLIDYIQFKKGGLIYITGDAIALNKLSLDVKVKINSIQAVDVVVYEKTKKAYYLITTYNGMKFKTAKTVVSSAKFNRAGALFTKCGFTNFRRISKD